MSIPPPLPAPKKKSRLGTGCLVLLFGSIGFIMLMGMLSSDKEQASTGEEHTKSPSSEAVQQPKTQPSKIGDLIKFEDSEWTVLDARDLGHTLNGGTFSDPKHSDGKFIYVRYKVKNTTDKEDSVLSTPALQDGKGRRYEEFDEQALYLGENEKSMTMEQLPSGLPKTFSAIFEIPADSSGLKFLTRDFAVFGKKETPVLLGF